MGEGIEVVSEIKEEDDDLCIDDGENEEEINNLRDMDVDFDEDIVTMNKTKGDEFLSKLCSEEEANDNNRDDEDDEGEAVVVNQEHSGFNE